MNANELMLGNYINKSGDIFKLASINTDNTIRIYNESETDTYGFFALRIFKPIPLTEKWLLDFGFKTDIFGFNFNLKDFTITLPIYFVYKNLKLKKLKYVHQLQNLHFSLTGNHLKLVEPK